MKVLSPNNTTHSISLIPRYYPDNDIIFTLYNESTSTSTVVANTYAIVNGLLTITFDYTFTNKDKFKFKLEENSVVYRGKLLITEQGTQDYKITKDLYYYE